MTQRIPLDHLTSDQYDELCDRLDQAETTARWYAQAESADIAAGSYAGRVEELRAEIDRLTAELADYDQRVQQVEELLRIAHDTSNRSEAARARAAQRADQFAELLREILYATHNIGSSDWARWRERLDTLTDQQTA